MRENRTYGSEGGEALPSRPLSSFGGGGRPARRQRSEIEFEIGSEIGLKIPALLPG